MSENDIKYSQLHLILATIPLNLAFILILLGVNFPSWLTVILLPLIFVAIGHLVLNRYFKYVLQLGVSKFKFYSTVFTLGLVMLIINLGLATLVFL